MSTETATLILECIDGKDDHLKIEIDNGRSIAINNCGGNNSKAIEELQKHSGEIIFTNNDGVMHFDASACSAAVKLNGNLVSRGNVTGNDLLRIGNSIWRSVVPSTDAAGAFSPIGKKSIQSHFSSIIGLEELKDFKINHIFSYVFKKHTFAQMEEQLVTGTTNNTPAITEIETD